MAITAIRGFNDILPGASEVWRKIEDTAHKVFSVYGYSEIRLPIVEKTELFQRSIGETTDIVEKEMYTFPDRHGDSMTLRPEGTASTVRAYIEHKLYTVPVSRLYYIGPMFRYERPQKGRYRQFHQIGAELLGDDNPGSDAEAISMVMELLGSLEMKGIELQINSLGCAGCRPLYKEKLLAFLSGRRERLCENCSRRIDTNPLRALDCKGAGCIEATKDAPSITDCLCGGCSDHFEKVRTRLGLKGIEPRVNPRMVRGLDYYSKTTFEITAEGLGSQNAVAAGGRYDRLVEDLGGPSTPCFGFAIGIERVALILSESGINLNPVTVFIGLGLSAGKKGIELVSAWRSAGIRVVEEHSDGALKNRMKKADRLGARWTVILGDDELKDGVVAIKDMKNGTQSKVAWIDVAGIITGA